MFEEEAPPVDRCQCKNRSFADLKALGSLEAIRQQTGVGVECKACIPYLKLMFATGETEFAWDDPRLEALEE